MKHTLIPIGLFAVLSSLSGAPPVIKGTLTITNKLGDNFQVGDDWSLFLTGAEPSATFTLCAAYNSGSANCIPKFGTTNPNGEWKRFGGFDNSTQGQWVEWIEFPSGVSNRLSFTVGTKPAIALTVTAPTEEILLPVNRGLWR